MISYKFFLIFLLLLIAISCHQSNNKANIDTNNIAPKLDQTDTSTLLNTTATGQAPILNVLTFVTLADSLLSHIQGKEIHLSYEIDTINPDQPDFLKIYGPLFISDNVLVKKYSFDPGKGNSELRLWIIEATFDDEVSASNAFNIIKTDAFDTGDKPNFTPGLTYSNDYVIVSSKNIYWLNSGCSYAMTNHKKLKQCMLGSLQVTNIQGSILCKCGQATCSNDINSASDNIAE